jgi:hypothetical protein
MSTGKVEQEPVVQTDSLGEDRHPVYIAEGSGKTANQPGAKERAVHNVSRSIYWLDPKVVKLQSRLKGSR